VLDHKIDS